MSPIFILITKRIITEEIPQAIASVIYSSFRTRVHYTCMYKANILGCNTYCNQLLHEVITILIEPYCDNLRMVLQH